MPKNYRKENWRIGKLSEKDEEKLFRASPIYLAPITVSLIIGIICSFLFLNANVEVPSITIMPETGIGSISNAVYFVILIAIGAYLMYFLLKKKVHFGIRLIIGIAVSAITFTLSILYFDLLFVILNWSVGLWALLLLGVLSVLIVDYFIFLSEGAITCLVILLLGGSLGAFLGITIPALSAVFILLLLAVYDVLAVYYGPIGKIASHGLENLPGVTFNFKEVHVGLGDLTFYSMLISNALISFGWKACMFAFVGILIGSYVAFKLLERKGMFPGLPIPIVLGLTLIYLSNIL